MAAHTTTAMAVNDSDTVVTITVGTANGSTPAPPVSLSKRIYGPIVITLENVLMPPEKLSPSPSAQDGLDDDTETFLRVGGSELIQTSGILLKLPQTAMATGQVLFQRFYYSKSFVRQAMEVTAMACIYLASKIEEAPRRIRDVINVFHHIRQIRSGKVIQPLILDPAYVRLKNDVMLAERRVLKELGFCVHVKHPHKIIVIYLQQLGYDRDKNFVQMSWNYMNDALRTNVFVRFKPEAIACACIFLSARLLKIPLPNAPAWFLVFDVTESEVTDIAGDIIALYDGPAINYDELEKKVDVLAKAYQELREKGKSLLLSGQKEDVASSSTNQSPDSRPPSPNRVQEVTKDGNENQSETGKKKSDVNGESGNNKVQRKNDAELSPPPKRSRRSPSPIIFNKKSYYDLERSPRRKHKKRKKSHYSRSRSLSRSRSRSRDRRSKKDREYVSRRRSPRDREGSYKDHYHSRDSYSSDRHKRKERNYS